MRVSGNPTSGNNGRFYIHSDHLGSTSVLTKYSDGYIRTDSLTRYTPFGSYRTGGPNPLTDRAYTGQRENMSLGLYYYNARYYLPGLGRFASADTIVPNPQNPQSLNRYAYTLNSPLNYTDPSGHCVVFAGLDTLACIAAWTAVVSLTVVGVDAATPNNDIIQDAAEGLANIAKDMVQGAKNNLDWLMATVPNENTSESETESNTSAGTNISQPKGLERDLENNETGNPLGTPKNLPDPNTPEDEIQEVLGPDWSPPINPDANWTNKNTGEWLRPDSTHENDPHWDYGYRGGRNSYGNSHGWRIRPDGSVESKK